MDSFTKESIAQLVEMNHNYRITFDQTAMLIANLRLENERLRQENSNLRNELKKQEALYSEVCFASSFLEDFVDTNEVVKHFDTHVPEAKL